MDQSKKTSATSNDSHSDTVANFTCSDSDIPQHVAVIMDGNGRWAKKRVMNRLKGHNAGIEAVRQTIRTANDIGVRYLTIYSFSTENWKRPQDEVDGLMTLFAETMLAEVDGLDAEDVRVVTIGDTSVLPEATRAAFEEAIEQTRENKGMTLVVAINYGGRADILHAVNKFLESSDKVEGLTMTEQDMTDNLYTAGIPDPELIIRTSGEMRMSNFLIWQGAYSEFVCTEVLWPDFDSAEFMRCIAEYQSRDRRFGGVR